MEEKPNYYAIIPANVRYDNKLKDKAKLLYGEITSLSNKSGECWASNKYFAELYGVSNKTISLLIKQLIERNYISSNIIYKKNSKEIEKRIITITPMEDFVNTYGRFCNEGMEDFVNTPMEKKVKENNTSINNTSINKGKKIKEAFKKPTIEQIEQYCLERNNGINANAFYDFYESKGWYVGKNKMKDWKACVRTWEKRNEPKKQELTKPKGEVYARL